MLNSHLLVLEEQAMADATKAEAEIAAGGWKGPLHGIPIGLKDIYNTAGIRTTGHSALFRDHVPAADAFTVSLLRNAGAVITSKLATWEFAIGGSSFDLPWPPARNPWDMSLDPSGSSSGSGAAVAAGLCMGAMGSDTGGSIRGPAAWCGIAGHKPTYGLLSRRGILPLSFSLDHAGPMCWTSEDCALMMQVLACHDPTDPGSALVPAVDYSAGIGKSLSGLRIGVVRHFFEKDLLTDPETIAALETSVAALRDLGAIVGDVTLSPFGAYADCGSLISRSEAYAIHQHWLRTTPELYGAFGRHRLMAGAFILAADYINAQRERSRLVAQFAEVMKTVDAGDFPDRPLPGATDRRGLDGIRLPALLQSCLQCNRQPCTVDLQRLQRDRPAAGIADRRPAVRGRAGPAGRGCFGACAGHQGTPACRWRAQGLMAEASTGRVPHSESSGMTLPGQ